VKVPCFVPLEGKGVKRGKERRFTLRQAVPQEGGEKKVCDVSPQRGDDHAGKGESATSSGLSIGGKERKERKLSLPLRKKKYFPRAFFIFGTEVKRKGEKRTKTEEGKERDKKEGGQKEAQ